MTQWDSENDQIKIVKIYQEKPFEPRLTNMRYSTSNNEMLLNVQLC